jgi:hypothetical protein
MIRALVGMLMPDVTVLVAVALFTLWACQRD